MFREPVANHNTQPVDSGEILNNGNGHRRSRPATLIVAGVSLHTLQVFGVHVSAKTVG